MKKFEPTIETIQNAFYELRNLSIKSNELKQRPIKCGQLFYNKILDCYKEPKTNQIVDTTNYFQLFGIEVILDKTMPENMANINGIFYTLN